MELLARLAKVNDRLAVWRHFSFRRPSLEIILAKVNDRLAVWRQVGGWEVGRGGSPCKSERPLSGLETPPQTSQGLGSPSCKSERPLSGLETQPSRNWRVLNQSLAKVNDRLAVWRQRNFLGPSELLPTCKSERPLSGLETS